MQNKLVFIVGPTAVGKTDLAFNLAKDLDGEIVSADSIQVYKGLDIISGKDLPKTAKYFSLPHLYNHGYNTGFYIDRGIPIFLLDIVEPSVPFSVGLFQGIASATINYILGKNKLPIVVGGTGLYIKSLLGGIETASVKPDLKLRKKLEKLSVIELQELLYSAKLKSLNRSDRKNPRRLIRAIEVSAHEVGDRRHKTENKSHELDKFVIGLMCDREILKQRIDARVEDRLKNGALEEAKKLFENYESLVPQIKNANGYKQLFSYMKDEASLEEVIYRWKISEYHHAKNQMTWFKKYGDVQWFDITKKGYAKDIEVKINKFLY